MYKANLSLYLIKSLSFTLDGKLNAFIHRFNEFINRFYWIRFYRMRDSCRKFLARFSYDVFFDSIGLLCTAAKKFSIGFRLRLPAGMVNSVTPTSSIADFATFEF